MEEQFCPCCGRHCALSNPSCERGKAYASGEGMAYETVAEHHDVCVQMRKKRYQTLDTDSKLICNIRDMGHAVRALSDGKASQSRILIVLHSEGAITQSLLTELLGVQPGTVSEVIGKLENAGLIERVINDRDRRTCTLRLTPDGEEKALRASEARKDRHGEMFGSLSDSEKADLLVLLEKVNYDWQNRYGGGHGRHGHGGIGHRHGRHGGHHRED